MSCPGTWTGHAKMPFLARTELEVKRTLEAAWEITALFSYEGGDEG